jgi:type IV pilus assembly protein PilY1
VSQSIPGNLLLTLSVEYPTAVSTANSAGYNSATTYVGYFDGNKCYNYQYDQKTVTPQPQPAGTNINSLPPNSYFDNTETGAGATTPGSGTGNYFMPVGATSATHTCSGYWSGNYLNWIGMQSIDPFRWALTGGYRVVDLTNYTVLEKAWASGQGGSGETPNKTITGSTTVSGLTPFSWPGITVRIWGLGNRIDFAATAAALPTGTTDYTETPWNPTTMPAASLPITNVTTGKAAVYSVKGRVAACVAGLLETNCTTYGTGAKPEGLIQQYSTSIRFGVMGYLNDANIKRDAGVLRAQMEFVGPTYPVPGQSASQTNTQTEWSSSTGVYLSDPDASDPTTRTLCGGSLCTTVAGGPFQSGVINYLNKFGESAQTYKTYDPVSELYYAAYRYFKYQIVNTAGAVTALGNVPQWSDLTTATGLTQQETWVDGFPVITTWNDPIQYACQKNFILGIGDVNTHASGNVPTGTSALPPQDNATYEPAREAAVNADNTINGVTSTNDVGVLEGLGSNLGDTNVPWCCSDDATYFMAGLALYAHTQDLRPNDPKFLSATNVYGPGNGANTGYKIAIQTVETYWLDVQEDQVYRYQNQFWLAGKYGGFAYTPVPPYAPYPTTTPIPLSNWASGQNLPTAAKAPTGYTGPYGIGDSAQPGGTGVAMPNNYFGAGNAQNMVAGLTTAFASITSQVNQISSPFGVASPNLVQGGSGSTAYASRYSSTYWSGDVEAYNAIFSSTLSLTETMLWSLEGYTQAAPNTVTPANEILALQLAPYITGGVTKYGWDTNRNVVTWNGTAGVPFRATTITTAQLAAFTTVTGANALVHTPQLYLNYLRGDRSNEGVPSSTSAGYRARDPATVLGDIVDSNLTVVAAPNDPYADVYNPGYSAFVTTYTNRLPVVYVGANDGMVHAFNGNPSGEPNSTGGQELFAYIPSLLFQGPSGTPAVNGLASLGAQPFSHHMLVDATPEAFSVDFSFTGASHPTIGAGNWHTLLIGGLGKGGRGYYALDVTNPAGFNCVGVATCETTVASSVLWEFTDSTMGYSFGDPMVLKTQKYGWVVVFTSGYNTPDGHNYLYFVNPTNGQLLERVSTSALDGGTPTNPAGMTYGSGFVASFADNTADSIYAGDLLGNVWRFDLTQPQGTSAPINYVHFAHVVGPDGYVQPITVRPLIESDPTTGTIRYVLFGTGQLLATTDIGNTHIQSFYSIRDGTVAAFASATTLPTGVSFPITRANLVPDSASLAIATGVTGTAAQPEGWYYDLPAATSGQGSPRVNINPVPDFGFVAFAANTPNGDVCYPTGTNQVFVFDIAGGFSELQNSSLQTVLSESVPGGMISFLGVAQAQSGKNPSSPFILAGTPGESSAGPTIIQPKASGGGAVHGLNWREVPTAD